MTGCDLLWKGSQRRPGVGCVAGGLEAGSPVQTPCVCLGRASREADWPSLGTTREGALFGKGGKEVTEREEGPKGDHTKGRDRPEASAAPRREEGPRTGPVPSAVPGAP